MEQAKFNTAQHELHGIAHYAKSKLAQTKYSEDKNNACH